MKTLNDLLRPELENDPASFLASLKYDRENCCCIFLIASESAILTVFQTYGFTASSSAASGKIVKELPKALCMYSDNDNSL